MGREPKRKGAKRSLILVVGHDPGRRLEVAREIEQLRPGTHRIESVSPDALGESQCGLDAAAAVALLGEDKSGLDFENWVRMRELPCSDRIILGISRNVPAADADLLIGTLEPRAVVDLPASCYALASALERTFPLKSEFRAQADQGSTHGLIGISQSIREVSKQIRQISQSRIPVLILGETGSGKEVVAHAIHQQSPRCNAPFIALNCGALPESLLESELFGNERGAFTGAERTRPGVFEQADGGTLFLDEIGEMPAAMQVRLLRALEDGHIRRLGGTGSISTDVRVLSATHRDLEKEVAASRFRQDLYFRLNTAAIFLPPLRRRIVDIPLLAQHFAEKFGAENAHDITMTEDFLQALCHHDFPGNIRELRNTIERAIAIAEPGDPISAAHLPKNVRSPRFEDQAGSLKERVDQLETHVLRETLEQFDGNRTRTAEFLKLSRAGLRQKMARLGI